MSTPRFRVTEDHQDPQTLIDPDLPTVDLVAERRFGIIAGAAALLSVVFTFVARFAAARDTSNSPKGATDDLQRLLDLGHSGTGQELGMVFRVVSGMLVVLVALFFYRAIKGRNPEHASYIPALGIITTIILSATVAVQFFEVRDIARDFVHMAAARQTNDVAKHALDHPDTALRLANILQLIVGVGYGIWISLTSFEATNVGLLTRFLGLFGTGAGLLTAIPIFGVLGTALFVAWLGSVGLLAIGYWPGGRPPAWETGQATLPWEQQGDSRPAGRQPQSEGGTT